MARRYKKRVKSEVKLIAGIPHIQVECKQCKALCWTQKGLSAERSFNYRCNGCKGKN